MAVEPFGCLEQRPLAMPPKHPFRGHYGQISQRLPTGAKPISANTSSVSSFARENRSQNCHKLPITENYFIDNYWKNLKNNGFN